MDIRMAYAGARNPNNDIVGAPTCGVRHFLQLKRLAEGVHHRCLHRCSHRRKIVMAFC
jgi:hypothetical protein